MQYEIWIEFGIEVNFFMGNYKTLLWFLEETFEWFCRLLVEN